MSHSFFKSLLSALIISLALLPVSLAKGFGPKHYPAQQSYGQGVYFAPYELPIFEAPSLEADIVEILRWESQGSEQTVFSERQDRPTLAKNIFIAFYPDMDVAMLPVLGENGEGWAEIVYNKAEQKRGWVPLRPNKKEKSELDTLFKEGPGHFGQFQSWFQFMRLNAKANGIYWLEGVSGMDRSPKMRPDDDAPLLPVMVIKDIRVMHARGNWLLVEVKDLNRSRPLGWVRWRDEDGQLMVFSNFSRQKHMYFPDY